MRPHHQGPNGSSRCASVTVLGPIIAKVLIVIIAAGMVWLSAHTSASASDWVAASGAADGAYGVSSTSPSDDIRDASNRSARALMQGVQEESRASSEIIETVMTLVDPSGKTHARRATIYQKLRSTTGMARLIRFHSPQEIAGAAVLALENAERDDDWWIYVPAYHVTRRIPPMNRFETFMGTDLSYEDLTDLRLNRYSFALAGMDTLDGVACQVLEARPLGPQAASGSLYGRLVYWVEVSRPLYPKALLYGHDGKAVKEVRNSGAVQVGDQWRWERTQVQDLRTRHRTVMEVRDRRIGEPIPDRVFTERALRRSG